MIMILHKRHLVRLGGLLCAGIFCLSLYCAERDAAHTVFSPAEEAVATVIVDAGHGGEDGGAVSADGVLESKLNLEIALRLDAILRFSGVETKLVRREDVSVYTPGAVTLRQKKVSDLQNRTAMVNCTEHAVLLSIHQNSLPSAPSVHGAQAFWNHADGAEVLGGTIQDRLNLAVNAGNEKASRKIPDSIYLMKKITAPGVIVECGFLSNREEAHRLGEKNCQTRLAAAIAAGCRTYLEEYP